MENLKHINTRHVCGVVSSRYIACRSIGEVAKENPVNASNLTLHQGFLNRVHGPLRVSWTPLRGPWTSFKESVKTEWKCSIQ